MDVAGWASHTSRQACIAEAQQYMWTFMAKYTQTPKAMQTCLQLPRRNSINLNIPAGYIPYTDVAAGAGSSPHLSAI